MTSAAPEQTDALERIEFSKLFAWLGALGLVRRDDVEEGAYWVYLRDLPFGAIKHAFTRAPSVHSRFFPTAAELRALAEPEARRLRHPASASNESPAPHVAPEPTLDPSSPYLELATRWEEESIEHGFDSERVSPRGIGEQRMRELNALMDRRPLVGSL